MFTPDRLSLPPEARRTLNVGSCRICRPSLSRHTKKCMKRLSSHKNRFRVVSCNSWIVLWAPNKQRSTNYPNYTKQHETGFWVEHRHSLRGVRIQFLKFPSLWEGLGEGLQNGLGFCFRRQRQHRCQHSVGLLSLHDRELTLPTNWR